MKTFKNNKTSLGKEKPIYYSDLLETCCNNIDPRTGVNATEMKSRLRLLDITQKDKNGNPPKEIKMEDSDFETAKKLTSEMKWAIIHKDILDFLQIFNQN